jgi:ATP-dependent DNA helicase RecQ
MIEYADSSVCLRGSILRYFGDAAARERCEACANCRPGALDGYERDLVRKVLSGIARAGERYGDRRIVDMLLGETADLASPLAGLSTTGLLRHESAEAVREWIELAINEGLIVRSPDRFRTLALTPRGREVMRGSITDVRIRRPQHSLERLIAARR